MQVEEYSVLYISRHVFDHIRPGRLSGWQVVCIPREYSVLHTETEMGCFELGLETSV